MTGRWGRKGRAGSRSFQTHLLDTSGKTKMYSAKLNFFKQLWRGSWRVERKVVVAGALCVESRKGGDGGCPGGGGSGWEVTCWEQWGDGVGCGGHVVVGGQAPKNIKHLFCLCVSKILTLTGVFFFFPSLEWSRSEKRKNSKNDLSLG